MDGLDDVRVTMAGAGDSMAAVKIEVVLAVARVNPDAPATLCGDALSPALGPLNSRIVRPLSGNSR